MNKILICILMMILFGTVTVYSGHKPETETEKAYRLRKIDKKDITIMKKIVVVNDDGTVVIKLDTGNCPNRS